MELLQPTPVTLDTNNMVTEQLPVTHRTHLKEQWPVG